MKSQALLLSGRQSIYFYIILKVGKWPGWCLLTYSLVWTEVGMCRQVPLCKTLYCGTSSSFIIKLTNQFNEMWSTSRPATLDPYNLPTFLFLPGYYYKQSRTRLDYGACEWNVSECVDVFSINIVVFLVIIINLHSIVSSPISFENNLKSRI